MGTATAGRTDRHRDDDCDHGRHRPAAGAPRVDRRSDGAGAEQIAAAIKVCGPHTGADKKASISTSITFTISPNGLRNCDEFLPRARHWAT